MEQDHIIKAIKELGYDGLCSFGNETFIKKDFCNAENIGIFNPSVIQVCSRKVFDMEKYIKTKRLLESTTER
jgi:hypothetical protein